MKHENWIFVDSLNHLHKTVFWGASQKDTWLHQLLCWLRPRPDIGMSLWAGWDIIFPHAGFSTTTLYWHFGLDDSLLHRRLSCACQDVCLALALASTLCAPLAPNKNAQAKNVCRSCQMSPGGSDCTWLRTTELSLSAVRVSTLPLRLWEIALPVKGTGTSVFSSCFWSQITWVQIQVFARPPFPQSAKWGWCC